MTFLSTYSLEEWDIERTVQDARLCVERPVIDPYRHGIKPCPDEELPLRSRARVKRLGRTYVKETRKRTETDSLNLLVESLALQVRDEYKVHPLLKPNLINEKEKKRLQEQVEEGFPPRGDLIDLGVELGEASSPNQALKYY